MCALERSARWPSADPGHQRHAIEVNIGAALSAPCRPPSIAAGMTKTAPTILWRSQPRLCPCSSLNRKHLTQRARALAVQLQARRRAGSLTSVGPYDRLFATASWSAHSAADRIAGARDGSENQLVKSSRHAVFSKMCSNAPHTTHSFCTSSPSRYSLLSSSRMRLMVPTNLPLGPSSNRCLYKSASVCAAGKGRVVSKNLVSTGLPASLIRAT